MFTFDGTFIINVDSIPHNTVTKVLYEILNPTTEFFKYKRQKLFMFEICDQVGTSTTISLIVTNNKITAYAVYANNDMRKIFTHNRHKGHLQGRFKQELWITDNTIIQFIALYMLELAVVK